MQINKLSASASCFEAISQGQKGTVRSDLETSMPISLRKTPSLMTTQHGELHVIRSSKDKGRLISRDHMGKRKPLKSSDPFIDQCISPKCMWLNTLLHMNHIRVYDTCARVSIPHYIMTSTFNGHKYYY